MLNYKIVIIIILFLLFNISSAQQEIEIKTLLLNGEYEKIIYELELKLNDKGYLNFDEHFILGSAFKGEMNYSRAIIAFNEAKKLEPSNIRNLLLLGNCYASNGNEIDAKLVFNEVLSLDNYNKNALTDLGRILLSLEEYNNASEIYENLISKDSTNAYFYSQLGICKYRDDNKEAAIENFEKSIALNHSNSKTILMLAKLYYSEKKYDETLEILEIGLMHNPNNRHLIKMLADVYYKKDQYHEAILKYLSAITMGDTSAIIYQKLGTAYYYMSFTSSFINTDTRELKLNEGIEALKIALDKDKNDPLNSLYIGLCFKELNELETAVKYFEETLDKVYPDYLGEVFYNLASSYDKMGDYVNSIQSYKKALDYKPDKQLINFYLANIYDRYYKDKSVAVLYYQKFVDESIEADENLIGYSWNRIKDLSQEAKFWGK
ncbi:MAG: tetratricopeptide repeat protein [Melioribacteraceae bacterium]|nr:tetratricopeptide repeat protein [Melioribacteraceae bacterium]